MSENTIIMSENTTPCIQRRTILSFDIGIKNLAFAILEISSMNDENAPASKHQVVRIIDWDVIDLFHLRTDVLEMEYFSAMFSKKFLGKPQLEELILYFQTQLSSETVTVPTASKKSKRILKSDLMATLDALLDATKKKFRLRDTSANQFGVASFKLLHFLRARADFLTATAVYIENQPAMKNPVMKSVQMLIYSWFLIELPSARLFVERSLKKNVFGRHFCIQFVSACNKTKVFEKDFATAAAADQEPNASMTTDSAMKRKKQPGRASGTKRPLRGKDKLTYKERKATAIEHTRGLFRDDGSTSSSIPFLFENDGVKWKQFFERHSKKDDLADCMLQGIFALRRDFAL